MDIEYKKVGAVVILLLLSLCGVLVGWVLTLGVYPPPEGMIVAVNRQEVKQVIDKSYLVIPNRDTCYIVIKNAPNRLEGGKDNQLP